MCLSQLISSAVCTSTIVTNPLILAEMANSLRKISYAVILRRAWKMNKLKLQKNKLATKVYMTLSSSQDLRCIRVLGVC